MPGWLGTLRTRIHSIAVTLTLTLTLTATPAFPSCPQSLRTDILSGALTPALLVTLSPADLATDELRRARQGLAAVDMESRRTDWLDENKTKIQASVGLDPTNVWEYDEDEESVELE